MDSPRVLYEDNHLLIVTKPPGFLAQADGRPRPDIVTWGRSYVEQTYHKPGRAYLGLTHRLDLAVGGLMALARTSKAAERLSRQFRERTVHKVYWALTERIPGRAEGLLESRLVRAGDRTVLAEPGEEGRLCGLKWRLIASDQDGGLLEIELLTGFKHQIRAQLSHGLGTPIVGDSRYGSARPASEGAIGLWAVALGFNHPTTREPLLFKTPPQGPLWRGTEELWSRF